MRHCATCECSVGEKVPGPAVSSEWARRAAKEATEAAIRSAKERRKKPASGELAQPTEEKS